MEKGRAGQQVQARRAMAKWEQWNRGRQSHTTSALAMAYGAMGNREEAFRCLEKEYQEHSNALTALKVEPAYDPLRSDRHFQDLLRRVGLADAGPIVGSASRP
jgi:hypothetical protein